MINEDKNMLLNLGRDTIQKLTEELNNELSKLKSVMKREDIDHAFAECEGIMAKLRERLDQLKSISRINDPKNED